MTGLQFKVFQTELRKHISDRWSVDLIVFLRRITFIKHSEC